METLGILNFTNWRGGLRPPAPPKSRLPAGRLQGPRAPGPQVLPAGWKPWALEAAGKQLTFGRVRGVGLLRLLVKCNSLEKPEGPVVPGLLACLGAYVQGP